MSSSGAGLVIRSEDVGAGFCGVTLVEFFNEFVGVCEVCGGGPLEFLVGSFVTHPLDVVKQFTRSPATEVVFGVQDFAELVLEFAIDLDRLRWWWLPIGESIRNRGFDLRNVEYRVDEPEFVRKSETDGVGTDAIDNLEGSEVRFGQFPGRSSCLNVLRQEEDLVARDDVGWRGAAIVGRPLVAFLGNLERFSQVLVELVEVCSELSSAEGGYVALGMDVEGWVIALVGEEGGHAGGGVRSVVVGEFREREEVGPVVLLVRAVMSEVLFQGLIRSFGLTIGLRVVS